MITYPGAAVASIRSQSRTTPAEQAPVDDEIPSAGVAGADEGDKDPDKEGWVEIRGAAGAPCDE